MTSATLTVPEVIADLTDKLEACEVRWESTGGGCYGVTVAARAATRFGSRWVLITEPNETYRTSATPAHPWGTNAWEPDAPRFAVGYYDDNDNDAPCQPQVGWEQHDDADRLAADAARWLQDSELPDTARRF